MNPSTSPTRSRTFAIRLLLTLATVVGGSLVAAQPASASTGYFGVLTLCKESACVNTGNVVLFWQRRLWADEGYSDLDGVFGPNTADATVHWQQLYNAANSPDIDVDGWVGEETWEASNLNPVWGYKPTSSDATYFYFTYQGRISGRKFLIRERRSDRVTWFKMPDASTWTDTSYIN